MQKYITWQPGNSTRYDLLLVKIEFDIPGHNAGTWMVVGPWANARPRIVYLPPDGGYISYDYIASKMDVGPHDASVVALMVAPHIGCEAITLDNLFEHYPEAPRGEPTVVSA
jgi:hypothetical protein